MVATLSLVSAAGQGKHVQLTTLCTTFVACVTPETTCRWVFFFIYGLRFDINLLIQQFIYLLYEQKRGCSMNCNDIIVYRWVGGCEFVRVCARNVASDP